MNRIPTKEQVAYIRRQYPVGTRITLNHMEDPQAPPPGTKGIAYVDDMGQIGVNGTPAQACPLSPVWIPFPRNPRRKKQNTNALVIWSDESEVI